MKQRIISVLIFWVLGVGLGWGQIGNSPYSVQGYGELHPTGNVRDIGMGGLAINGSPLYINQQNPALLQQNKLTIFDAGYFAERRNISVAGEQQYKSNGGNLMYLILGFPVNKRWTTSFQLTPVSYVNYQNERLTPVEGQSQSFARLQTRGEGGFSRISWANGVGIDRKGKYSIGALLGYTFGNIENKAYTEIQDRLTFLDNTQVGIYEKMNARGIVYKGGIFFTDTLFNKTLLNLGATFQGQSDLTTVSDRQTERITSGFSSFDTLAGKSRGRLTLPAQYQIGIALERKYNYLLGAEIGVLAGSKFRHPTLTNSLKDGYFVNIGAEFTPNYQSVTSYLKRITYRGGFRFIQHPWQYENTSVQEINLTMGITFPMPNFASFNLAGVMGFRGYNLANGVREDIYRICLGITINEQWFVRRRFD